jgi:hypothetical protein
LATVPGKWSNWVHALVRTLQDKGRRALVPRYALETIIVILLLLWLLGWLVVPIGGGLIHLLLVVVLVVVVIRLLQGRSALP